jgi:hypothetical protein
VPRSEGLRQIPWALGYEGGIAEIQGQYCGSKTEGFFEIPERELWVSHERRMAFGHIALRENGRQWLRDSLDEQRDAGNSFFTFNLSRQTLTVLRPRNFCRTAIRYWKKSVSPFGLRSAMRPSGQSVTRRDLELYAGCARSMRIYDWCRCELVDLLSARLALHFDRGDQRWRGGIKQRSRASL